MALPAFARPIEVPGKIFSLFTDIVLGLPSRQLITQHSGDFQHNVRVHETD